MGKHKNTKNTKENLIAVSIVCLGLLLFSSLVIATPSGPSSINITSNTTKVAAAGHIINISGGYISKVNITATTQNPRWKAFAGWIDGKFTLDDAAGSTIYDWDLASITGEVYATRASGTPSWGSIECANATIIAAEDTALEHSGGDNIAATFSENNTGTFTVAGTSILADECKAINTYVNNESSSEFEEVILYDSSDIIFATILEEDEQGYDGSDYDFQMIVPENGNETFSGSTAYYLYVELTS